MISLGLAAAHAAIPPSLDEMVRKGHPARVVNDVIHRINIQALLDAYHIKGSSSYHPQMLLKVLVYGYVSNVYSSRKLEVVCRENINFMRMKEDHMKNGQLKPGYNVQISTSNQYIVNYTIHPNPTDTRTLSAHLAQHRDSYGKAPASLTADAGYGSEENFQLLENLKVEAFVKYGLFDKQQKSSFRNKRGFAADQLFYHAELDCYICPMGQRMDFIGTFKQKTSSGFAQHIKKYQARNCAGCPVNGACHKSKGNRIIQINENLDRYKAQVFANIKQNHGFRRFMLRGKEKVAIEWGLLAIAQNIRKKAA